MSHSYTGGPQPPGSGLEWRGSVGAASRRVGKLCRPLYESGDSFYAGAVRPGSADLQSALWNPRTDSGGPQPPGSGLEAAAGLGLRSGHGELGNSADQRTNLEIRSAQGLPWERGLAVRHQAGWCNALPAGIVDHPPPVPAGNEPVFPLSAPRLSGTNA